MRCAWRQGGGGIADFVCMVMEGREGTATMRCAWRQGGGGIADFVCMVMEGREGTATMRCAWRQGGGGGGGMSLLLWMTTGELADDL